MSGLFVSASELGNLTVLSFGERSMKENPTAQEIQDAINDSSYYLAQAKKNGWKEDIVIQKTILFALKKLQVR